MLAVLLITACWLLQCASATVTGPNGGNSFVGALVSAGVGALSMSVAIKYTNLYATGNQQYLTCYKNCKDITVDGGIYYHFCVDIQSKMDESICGFGDLPALRDAVNKEAIQTIPKLSEGESISVDLSPGEPTRMYLTRV